MCSSNKRGGSGWRCEVKRKPWLQWPWGHDVQHHSRRAGGYSVPSQPQTTGELTLPFWGTFLEEFHGICYVKLAEKKLHWHLEKQNHFQTTGCWVNSTTCDHINIKQHLNEILNCIYAPFSHFRSVTQNSWVSTALDCPKIYIPTSMNLLHWSSIRHYFTLN